MRRIASLKNFGIYFVLIVILLITPGSTSSVFDGLPLSSIPELFVLLVLIFSGTSKSFKLNFRALCKKINHRYLLAFALVLVVSIPIKSISKNIVPIGRFDGCYHSYVRSDDMAVPRCEPFFSSKFEGGRSRLDKNIDFKGLNYPLRDINVSGSNWNLSFVNNEQFLGRYGNYEQVKHPFRVNWKGEFSVEIEQGYIPITYVGFGSIRIDSNVTKLPSNFGSPKTEWVFVSRGKHEIEVDYSYTSLQMKPVNGVDYATYGYYATIRIGKPQAAPVAIADVLSGWAVSPEKFERFEKILYISASGNKKEIQQAVSRVDVFSYLGVSYSNPFIGFSTNGVPPNIETKIVGITAGGKRNVILRGDGKKWIEEPAVSQGKLWYRIDDSFDSGEKFGTLQPLVKRSGLGILVTAIDVLTALSMLGITCLLAWSFRRHWIAYVYLLCAIFTHIYFLNSKIGWGYDGVEGSALIYVSAFFIFGVLSILIFLSPDSFLSVGLLGAIYLAIDRIIHINPGMRIDYFSPIVGKSPASNLGAVFFRPGATDWLIHASNTRSSLFRGLLFGNEPVFYLQPGYRYFAPIFHYVFGDGDVRLSIAVMFAVFAGFIFLLSVCVENVQGIFDKIFSTVLLAVALFFGSSWVISYFVLVQTTEIPTWPLFLFSAYFLIKSNSSTARLVLPGVMLGLATCMRPNQVIGHGVFLIVFSLFADREFRARKTIGRLIQRLVAMGVVSSLPLVHNLYFGHRFVLFSTSRAGGSFDFSEAPDHLMRYLYVFTRPLRSSDLTSQGIMGAPGGAGYSRPLYFAIAALLIAWVVSMIRSLRIKRISNFALLSPVMYLLPIIPYHAYFPRHAIVFWLALFAAIVMVEYSPESELSSQNQTFKDYPITHF